MRRPLLLLLAIVAAACGRRPGGGDEDEEAGSSQAVQAVVDAGTAIASVQPMPQLVQAIGTVAPRPGHFAQLAAPAATRVARIFVSPGQRVARGDALIEFERAPFDAAAQSAAASLEAAQRAYDRAVRLVQAGILAQKDSDQAAADLAQARVADVTARRAQELATLRSPLAGVVTEMDAVLGAAVDPSRTLVAIADPAAMDLVFSVTPTDAGRIRSGDAVTVTAGEGAAGEALGAGVVTAVGAEVDSASRAVLVRARLGRPARPLRIGESVFGRLVTGANPQAVTVPVQALVPAGDGYRVFVVDSASIAHARPVRVGARTETLAEILSGLAAGETVVTTGAYGVEDGARIQRRGAPR